MIAKSPRPGNATPARIDPDFEMAGVFAVELLEAARSLLMKSTAPVKTIAAACGYPTLQNFYRHFKRRYGTSPQDAERLTASRAASGACR